MFFSEEEEVKWVANLNFLDNFQGLIVAMGEVWWQSKTEKNGATSIVDSPPCLLRYTYVVNINISDGDGDGNWFPRVH